GHAREGRLPVGLLKPGWRAQILMSPVDQVFHPLSVIWPSQQVLNSAWGNRLEHGPGVMRQGPELGVELSPQLVSAPVPRPTQVQRELGERLDPDIFCPAHDEGPSILFR